MVVFLLTEKRLSHTPDAGGAVAEGVVIAVHVVHGKSVCIAAAAR